MTSSIDPIAYMAAQIKAKASQAKAAGKTAAQQSAATNTPKKEPRIIPDIYKGERPTGGVLTSRERYLKSIDSSALKQAAMALGIDIKFGVKPMLEAWKTTEIQGKWDQITQIMADLKASQSVTQSLADSLPENL